MAEAYYEPTPATDGATMNPVPGAVFEVYEIADTSFSTPLSLRVGSGNPTTSVTASDTLATLPGVYVTSPNYEHIWKSGTFEWRRDSIDGAKKAIEDAKIAASNSASASDASAVSAANSAQAAQDAAALVDAPADQIMADTAANPATAFATQLSATFARKGEDSSAISIPRISDFRLSGSPGPVQTIPTYDGSGVAVHPSVLYFPNGWNGWRYWMAMTPYPGGDAELEDPSIVVSQNGNTWQVPAGVTNPLVPSPAGSAYNSDTALTMDPSGKMHMVFRDTGTGSPQQDRIILISSSDGVNWSAPQVIISTDSSVQRLLSPAVWWDAVIKQWVMIAVDIVGGQILKRLTAPAITGPWSAAAAVTITPALVTAPWHVDAQLVGGTVIALVQDGSSAGGRLWLLESTDGGVTFRRSDSGLTPPTLYKSTFVPLIGPSGLMLDVYTSTLSGVVRRIMATTEPPSITKAAFAVKPFTLGDTYARADSTTSLGNATSGQAYTVWAGTPGIINGHGYAAVAGNTKPVISATADGIFGLDLAVVDTQAWLLFRSSDTNNGWRFGVVSGGYQLQKIVAGVATNMGGGGAPAVGDRVSVRCEGSTITAMVNGYPVLTVTDVFNQAATFVGWQLTTAPSRVKNLTARGL